MKNKVLIQLIVPDIEEKFDLFIPINKKIGTIKNSIIDSIEELNYDKNIRKLKLYHKDSSMLYNKVQEETYGGYNGGGFNR